MLPHHESPVVIQALFCIDGFSEENGGLFAIPYTHKNRKRPKNSEVNRLVADNSLLKELIKYSKPYSFERGLKLTINWMLENSDLFEKNIYKI